MTNSLSQIALDLVPVSKWNNYFEYPTVAAIRQWMFRNTKDFNTTVIRKLGNRNYIKISAFNQWVEDVNN